MSNRIFNGFLLAIALAALPLAEGVAQAQTTSVAAPGIEAFNVAPIATAAPGNELVFTLYGSPGGAAAVRIDGATGAVVLAESEVGVYEGSYTIRKRDKITAKSKATANLRLGNRVVSAVIDGPLVGRAAARRPHNATPAKALASPACAACGVVEAVNLVEVKGEGSYIGKIGGGLAGILLGSQIGSGRGTTVAQVAGAAGGAYAGNEIEKQLKASKHYEVLVRLDNGGTQTVTYAEQPGFNVGDEVKIENRRLVLIQAQ
ncbi:glycine zipper 2TM domain-containing protein [Rhodocyclus tenuis]|uniref:Outer membrane lipoprotein SlyB n=1 Tax=Rhodocyclus tenuis TaxID=1066 RepID=A0A840G4M0_RHOTE|nr:glycine zipper 2TM domain-containing protein [Rhodocyclus tenuis]MBB4246281.1 outer membrane lipoprotein SlyB [Rhodocyclus tenuis]